MMKKNTLFRKSLVCGILVLFASISTMPLAAPVLVALDEPTPPDQPLSGPGGSDYSHAGVKKNKYKSGAEQYWIFEPTDPTPATAPLIVFNHGWCALYPSVYISWIEHIVKHGNIVVYPRYQRGIYFGFRQFSSNAITAVKNAIIELQQGTHVRPDLDKFAIVGHSLGGGITADMAALAQTKGLPIPKAIMPVQPAYNWTTNPDLNLIPNTTLMVVVVGADDTIVGTDPGKTIFYEADQIPFDRKDFVIQVTDRYGSPDLIGDHIAPLCIPGFFSYTVDAMDYYSTWKLFDALTDYAFYGINGEYCLGNTSEQRYMGLWSDGIPVKELIVTDTPVDTPFNQQNNQQNQSSQQSSSIPSSQKAMSVISSTGTILEKSSLPILLGKPFDSSISTPAYTRISDAVDSPKELSVRGHIAYAYISYSSIYTNGPCYLDVTNPGTIIKLSDEQVTNFLCGGTYTSDERWLCCQYGTGVIYQVTTDTGHITVIGGGGNNLNDLAYDPVTNKMYGVGDTALYLIDSEDGSQTLIGGSNNMVGLAFNREGTFYGIGLNGLYTIDVSTGEVTFICSLINCTSPINAEFDIDNDILYLIGYTTGYMTGLYTCDTETGECNLVGQFEGGVELTALAIPYNWSGPTADFNWTPNLPIPGETILFNASASYDPDGYITLYEWDWNNDGVYEESHTTPTSTHIWESPGSYLVFLRVTDNAGLTGIKTKTIRVGNQLPNPPIITGSIQGKVGVKYEYNFSLSDPENDLIYLRVDWGNGTPSPWLGPYNSDTKVKLSHTWDQKGTYTIRAQAKDIYGAESEWRTLEVTMPKNQQNSQQLLNQLFFQIIQRLLNTR